MTFFGNILGVGDILCFLVMFFGVQVRDSRDILEDILLGVRDILGFGDILGFCNILLGVALGFCDILWCSWYYFFGVLGDILWCSRGTILWCSLIFFVCDFLFVRDFLWCRDCRDILWCSWYDIPGVRDSLDIFFFCCSPFPLCPFLTPALLSLSQRPSALRSKEINLAVSGLVRLAVVTLSRWFTMVLSMETCSSLARRT